VPLSTQVYLTIIIPGARMGSESMAMRLKAEWATDAEAMRSKRNNKLLLF